MFNRVNCWIASLVSTRREIEKPHWITHLFLVCFLTINANATLTPLGDGLIYDDYFDITWTADANLSKTMGYTGTGVDPNTGAMTWAAALNWATNLTYAEVTGWRLPSAYNKDGTGPFPTSSSEAYATYIDCEFRHLFYDELGGTAHYAITNSTDPDLALFSNIIIDPGSDQHDSYWTSTDGTVRNRAFYFGFINGGKWQKPESWVGVVWAVHDGVVEPPTIKLDSDGDDLSNYEELETTYTNPLISDTDGDGLDDGAEVNTYNTNPLISDTDGDGINDGDEVNTHGTNPLNSDSDGDGFSDGLEVSNAGRPLISEQWMIDHIRTHGSDFDLYSSNSVVDIAIGQVAFSITNQTADLSLQLEQSNDLQAWTNAGDFVTWSIPVSTNKAFYRVRAGH